MKKDFKKWHNKKEFINKMEQRPFFHELEIWFCYVGVNVGFEQDGQGEDFLRPVIIFRKFNNEIFWGIPLTKSIKKIKKESLKYYYKFSFIDDVKSLAILSQIRLIDSKRLSRRIGYINENNFKEMKEKLKELFP